MVLFIGGPLDGATLPASRAEEFIWTDGKKCYRAPARGRLLYKNLWTRDDRAGYLYAGYRWVRCSCGSYHQQAETCSLCGADLKAA